MENDVVVEAMRAKVGDMLQSGTLTVEALDRLIVLGLLWRKVRPVSPASEDCPLTIAAAAERLGISKRKFDEWRQSHPNHPHHRLDRRVFYTQSDIKAIEQQWQKGMRSI